MRSTSCPGVGTAGRSAKWIPSRLGSFDRRMRSRGPVNKLRRRQGGQVVRIELLSGMDVATSVRSGPTSNANVLAPRLFVFVSLALPAAEADLLTLIHAEYEFSQF